MIKRFGTEIDWLDVELSLTFGEKLKYKQAIASDKVRYKGEDIIAEMPKPEIRQHQDVRLLLTAIKDWSKKDLNGKVIPVTIDTIINDRDLGDAFEDAIDAILVQNKLRKAKEAESKDAVASTTEDEVDSEKK